jgi:hypothetical protein
VRDGPRPTTGPAWRLDPVSFPAVFLAVPLRVCIFSVLLEVTRADLGAVVRVPKRLAAEASGPRRAPLPGDGRARREWIVVTKNVGVPVSRDR